MRTKKVLSGVLCVLFFGVSLWGISTKNTCADDVTVIIIEDNSRLPRRPPSSLHRPYAPAPRVPYSPAPRVPYSPRRTTGGTVGIIILEEITPLMSATRSNNKKRVEELLNDGAGINQKNRYGCTALMEASKDGLEILKLLLDRGADVSIKDDDGDTALHYAAMYFNKSRNGGKTQQEICQCLLAAGADINAVNENGETPLMKAAFANEQAFQFLLTKKANVNLKNKKGETALHLAVNTYPEIVEQLLENGADANAKTEANETPLLLAVSNPLCKIKSVELLLAAGADANFAAGDESMTPLTASFHSGHPEVCKMLLAAGADIKKAGGNGVPPIFLAVEFGTPEIFEFFADRKVDLKQKNPKGETLLFSAARAGNLEMCELLLKKGVEINAISGIQRTAVAEAVMNNHLEVTKFLVEKGAKLPKNNSAMFMQAVKSGNLEMCKFLVSQKVRAVDDAGSREKLLHCAVETGDPEMCRYVLEFNKNVNVTDNMERNALYLAVKNLNFDICQLLISRGIKVNATPRFGGKTPLLELLQSSLVGIDPGKSVKVLSIAQLLLDAGASMTPPSDGRRSSALNPSAMDILKLRGTKDFIAKHFQLLTENYDQRNLPSSFHISAYKGDLKEMQRLLTSGTDIDSKDASGETALHFAIRGGKTEACKFLLEKGADTEVPGIFNATALHYAAAYGRADIISLLMKKKADLNAPDTKKGTPLLWAIYASRPDCAELLIKGGAETALEPDQPSPLRAALTMNQADLCKMLCQNGVDVNEELRRVGFGEKFLMLSKPFTVSQLQILKDCGLDFTLADFRGDTLLHQLVGGRGWDAVLFAMENGADISARNDAGKTPLEATNTFIIPAKVRAKLLSGTEMMENKEPAAPKKTTTAKKNTTPKKNTKIQ